MSPFSQARLRRAFLASLVLLPAASGFAQEVGPGLDELRDGIRSDFGIAVSGNPTLQALSVLRQSMGLFTPEQRSGLSEVVYRDGSWGSIQGIYTAGEDGRGRIELAPSGAENLRTVTFLGTQHVGVANGGARGPGLVQDVLATLPEGAGGYPTSFSRTGRMAQFGEVVTSWMLEPLGQAGTRPGWSVPGATDELLRQRFPAAVPQGSGTGAGDPFSVLPADGSAGLFGNGGAGLLGMDLGIAPAGTAPGPGQSDTVPVDEFLPEGG